MVVCAGRGRESGLKKGTVVAAALMISCVLTCVAVPLSNFSVSKFVNQKALTNYALKKVGFKQALIYRPLCRDRPKHYEHW